MMGKVRMRPRDTESEDIPALVHREIATTRTDPELFYGWLGLLKNADPVIETESGGAGVAIYEDLLRDWQVAALLNTRSKALQACEWSVEAAGETLRDRRVAQLVRDVLQAANFDALTDQLMQAVVIGYKPVEVMWTVRGGMVMVEEFRGRRPSRFVFDMDNNLKMLTVESRVYGESVPERKFLVWSYGGYDHNPYGRGVGNQLYWPVWFKKNAIQFWLTYAEKFGSPTVVGRYSPGMQQTERRALLSALTAIQQNSAITVPDGTVLELLEKKGSGDFVYEKLCEYFDKAIAKVLLGQTLTSEPGRVGSYNLGKIHDDVRRDILEADGDSMCEYLNRTLVRWVVDYNFSGVGVNEYPRVWRNTENPPDLFELAQRDKILFVDMGLSDRVPTKYIEDTYHVPLAAGGERVIGRVAAPVTPSGPMGRGSVKTRRGPGVTEGDDDDEESHGGAFAEPEGEEDDEDAAMLAMLAYIDHVTMRAADMAACAVHNAVGWLRMVDQAGAMRVMGVSSLGMAAKLVSGIEDMLLESARVGYGGEAVGWGGLPGEAGARALTVARLTDESILSDIKAMVERALVEGWSGDQFRARAREVLGEWYAAPGEPIWETMPDGTTRKRVAGWRLDTIYRTNAQCVFSAGRYRRLMADVRGREYWQYRGVLDERTRETHAAMFYKVYPREHPVWEIWYPPNGFNCRCYVVGLTRADIDAGEWRVSQDMPTVVPDEGWAYNFGRVSMESWEGGHAVQEG